MEPHLKVKGIKVAAGTIGQTISTPVKGVFDFNVASSGKAYSVLELDNGIVVWLELDLEVNGEAT